MILNRWLFSFGLLFMLAGTTAIGSHCVIWTKWPGGDASEFFAIFAITGFFSLLGTILIALSLTFKNKVHKE
jgi:MFS-type transporter involved in bile tolerance (Atg22 family)